MKYMTTILVLSLLTLILTSGVILSDEGDIEVLEQKAESHFPDGIQFTVKVRSSEKINDIRVFFKIVGNARQTAYRPAAFEPGTEVTASILLSLIHI